MQAHVQQPSEVHRSHAVAEPDAVAFDTAVGDPTIALAHEPGETALHHGSPARVGALKLVGVCLVPRRRKQGMLGMDFDGSAMA